MAEVKKPKRKGHAAGRKNPVAKYARKVNRAALHKDLKRASKRGEQKHKQRVVTDLP